MHKRFRSYQRCHPSMNMDKAVVIVSVLGWVGCISLRPEVERDLSIPLAQDTGLGDYSGERDGAGKMNGRGNMTWPDESSYQVGQPGLLPD